MVFPKAADIRPGNWINGLGEVVLVEQTTDTVTFFNSDGESLEFTPTFPVIDNLYWTDRKLIRITKGTNDYGESINGVVAVRQEDGNYRNIDIGELYTCGRSIIEVSHELTPVSTASLDSLFDMYGNDDRWKFVVNQIWEELHPSV